MLTFVRNRGELAEGWYDPATLKKANNATKVSTGDSIASALASHNRATSSPTIDNGSEEDDAPGPALPSSVITAHCSTSKSRLGPTVPNLQDLELKRGTFWFIHYLWRRVSTRGKY